MMGVGTGAQYEVDEMHGWDRRARVEYLSVLLGAEWKEGRVG